MLPLVSTQACGSAPGDAASLRLWSTLQAVVTGVKAFSLNLGSPYVRTEAAGGQSEPMTADPQPHAVPVRASEQLATLAAIIACLAAGLMMVLLLLEWFTLDSPLLPAVGLYWTGVGTALLALGMAFLVTVRERQIPFRAYLAIAAALVALLIAGSFMLTVARRVAGVL